MIPSIHPEADAQTTLRASTASEDAADNRIKATVVAEGARMAFLPRVFGPGLAMAAETVVYGWMKELCADYNGGYWDFIDLSNGGFYMRLSSSKLFAMRVDGNGFGGALSADAASIVASLFAINQLLFQGADHLHDAYYALRDFALQQPEWQAILRAID